MSSYSFKTKNRFLKVINYSINDKLNQLRLRWEKNKCMTIVLCSKGYPGNYEKNKHIDLKNINENKKLFIYHAGTKRILNKIYSNGGRVFKYCRKRK